MKGCSSFATMEIASEIAPKSEDILHRANAICGILWGHIMTSYNI
ncbi:hypothetical protein SLEP1_g18462 [Rubroshorea leprosula]|uniref:Uncharacterized protein n=1 Tax=Rubroshorea leprosula TaxID=152421 RepID=A0AAV5J342_9ROSI|nr:hypothetical protein SLEP1_g18462 [Rubroshorea leprosula]